MNQCLNQKLNVKSHLTWCTSHFTCLPFDFFFFSVRGVPGPGKVCQSDDQRCFHGGLWQIYNDCPEQIWRGVCGYCGEFHCCVSQMTRLTTAQSRSWISILPQVFGRNIMYKFIAWTQIKNRLKLKFKMIAFSAVQCFRERFGPLKLFFLLLYLENTGIDEKNVYNIWALYPPFFSFQVSVYRHGEKMPEAKPTLTPKTIIPPKLPIEIPQPKSQPPPSSAPSSAPSPAPSAAHSPAPSPAPPRTPGKGLRSPTPSRRK